MGGEAGQRLDGAVDRGADVEHQQGRAQPRRLLAVAGAIEQRAEAVAGGQRQMSARSAEKSRGPAGWCRGQSGSRA